MSAGGFVLEDDGGEVISICAPVVMRLVVACLVVGVCTLVALAGVL